MCAGDCGGKDRAGVVTIILPIGITEQGETHRLGVLSSSAMIKRNIRPLRSTLHLLPRSHTKASLAVSAGASATAVWHESNYSIHRRRRLAKATSERVLSIRLVVAKGGAACWIQTDSHVDN